MSKLKKGTCSHCGRKNTSIIKGLCRKHYDQLKKYGKFLDNSPRILQDPNEIIFDEKLDCYKIILYDCYGNPNGKEVLIDKEDYDKCKGIRWGIRGNYCANNENVYIGRFLLGLDNNDNKIIIYKNNNVLDNRRNNIRVGSKRERGIMINNKSEKYKDINGVSKCKGKWIAKIFINNMTITLGSFDKKEDAIYARRIAEFYSNYNLLNPNIYPLIYIPPENYFLNLDPNKRTKYDLNEFIFHYDEGYCEIILYNSSCEKINSALIDIEDYDRCKDIKWSYSKGYAIWSNKSIFLHRYILNYKGNMSVDHKNRNKLDNRKENLRIITQRQNLINKDYIYNTETGIAGVRLNKCGTYDVSISVNNKNIYLGRYQNIEYALFVRRRAEYIYGYYEVKNYPLLYNNQEEKKLIKPLIYEK